ncbi:MAG: exonuclease domain-containing protein [Hyphomicrobium sp.]
MASCIVSIDVETANASRASICQLGLVGLHGRDELWRWSSLVDPEEMFERKNFEIHRIHPNDVLGAPRYPDVLNNVLESIAGQIVVSWTDFDQVAISHAADKYSLPRPECFWLDACLVARHVWSELPNHQLATVASALGLEFNHHDALSDAWACGTALSMALSASKTDAEYWLRKMGQNVPSAYGGPARVAHPIETAREGKPSLPLSGHVVLFTGEFSLGKPKLGELANSLGCAVKTNFSKKITLLVYGAYNPIVGEGETKSGKHRQAEEALQSGQDVTIMCEEGFLTFLASNGVALMGLSQN